MLNSLTLIACAILNAQSHWTEPFRVRWNLNDVTVQTRKAHPLGQEDVQVWSSQEGPRKRVYKSHSDRLSLTNVAAWHIDESLDDGLWLSFEYSSGSSNHVAILGPDGKGAWSKLLEFDAMDCLRFPPETVDLQGVGSRDILALTNAVYDKKDGKMDKQKSRVTVWRWSSRQGIYVRIATCSYADRLKARATTP